MLHPPPDWLRRNLEQQLAPALPTPALRKLREERGTRFVGAVKETKGRATRQLTNGRNEAGLQVIDKALEAIQGGERFYEAELRRLQGELQLAQNSHSTSEPEKCFMLSHKIALCQKANLFAFRTAISLARLWRQLGRTK